MKPRRSAPGTRAGRTTAADRGRRPAPKVRSPGGRRPSGAAYVLRLYVTGNSRASRHAVERVREFCSRKLDGVYDLEVIDIYQLPALARDEQIVATPTLIRILPAPLRRFIGDLSNVERVFFGLDVRVKT